MSVLVMPASISKSMSAVEQAAEGVQVHYLVKTAVFFLIGKISESDLKSRAREAQIPLPTFTEAIDCISWVLCEAVRCHCTVGQFREFIAEFDFLNTPQVLQVYQDSIDTIHKCLTKVSPTSDHFVSIDWRVQVEYMRRSLRNFRRTHVVMDFKTTSGIRTLEATPDMLVQLHDTLDEALQSCRTAQFRRIQRFVK
ncbi:COMM domain-containing protein 2 [Tritrichomonas musculus]|uniref:COMM domain-containing protein 2 n=1 Tax=Tritrichomonas musculus TaxID=1915356 RepID=A0ABR2KEC8_9EUKA